MNHLSNSKRYNRPTRFYHPVYEGDRFPFTAMPLENAPQKSLRAGLDGKRIDPGDDHFTIDKNDAHKDLDTLIKVVLSLTKKILSPKQREAFHLYFTMQKTYQQAGVIMGGISAEAIRRLLQRGHLRILQHCLSIPEYCSLIEGYGFRLIAFPPNTPQRLLKAPPNLKRLKKM